MSLTNVRALAAQAVLAVVDKQKSLTQVLSNRDEALSAPDQGLLQLLCFGTCRHFFSVNALTKMMLDKPLPEQARPVQAALWVGLYQLAHTDMAEHAVIHETVEAVKQLKLDKYAPLVNAILRRFQREKGELMEQLQQSDVPRFDHPKWLIKMLSKSWPDHWQSICEEANIPGPMTLRVNTHLQSREQYSRLLSDISIEHTNGKYALTSLYLNHPSSVEQLPNFEQGAVSVQDEAAQLAAAILDPQPGEHILDACCAPGGKTCHILEYTGNQASVVALDADATRLKRVQENLDRLSLNANVLQGEAQSPDQWWDGTLFDRILLDVPCSATGVIRRHPDIKLLRQREDIDNLATLQQEILRTAWGMLKPGGQLLYATCSILPLENQKNIEAFLSNQADVKLTTLELSTGLDTGFGHQLFPQQQGHDGFFYALLTKLKTPSERDKG